MHAATIGSQPAQSPRMVMHLDNANAELKGLHNAISELEARLSMALDPPSQEASPNGMPQPASPNYLDRVSEVSHGVAQATRRINDLAQRLHV